MKSVSAGLEAHLQLPETTLATCWLVTLINGGSPTPVYGFTDHDRNLLIDGVTYEAASGMTATNISSRDNLDVDNLSIDGVLQSPSITEDDLRAGLWDHAEFRIFQVNWADLTQGQLKQRKGHLGEVRVTRQQFVAELLGLMQAYTTSIGQITSPGCRATLGDAKCTVDLAPFTVTGTFTGIGLDTITLADSGRTEPGPPGGVAIQSITPGPPGVVTLATPYVFSNHQIVTLSGIVGPTRLNTQVLVINPLGGSGAFELAIDITDTTLYPAYVSGGTVTPQANSGYFDFGKLTITSGPNAGISREIKSYITGQFTVQTPFPYTVSIGDTYEAIAGCDKIHTTCRDRFNNIVNFRGEPFLRGRDQMVQVGRHV